MEINNYLYSEKVLSEWVKRYSNEREYTTIFHESLFRETREKAFDEIKEKYKDYLCRDYIKYHDDTYLLFVWPKGVSVHGKSNITDLFEENVVVLSKKMILFNFSGLSYFMSEVYSKYGWIGTPENSFKGAKGKAFECWDKNGMVNVYLVESSNKENIIRSKEHVRKYLKCGKASMHSTDNSEETNRLADIVYNYNSVDMLMKGCPYRFPELYHKVQIFKGVAANYNLEKFIIDSSSVLGLYGLRKTNDIDFISDIDLKEEILFEDIIGNHIKHLKYYNMEKEELIYNPDNYLIFWGVKFITLSILKKFKGNRSEKPKDIRDMVLIDSILLNKYSYNVLKIRFILKMDEYYRGIKKRIKKFLYRIMKKDI